MPSIQREIRYLTAEELTRLRRHAEARALQARGKGTIGAVRAWALLDTLLSSGLRASEVAALRVSDCLLGYGQASLVVRQGKGAELLHRLPVGGLASRGLASLRRDSGGDLTLDRGARAGEVLSLAGVGGQVVQLGNGQVDRFPAPFDPAVERRPPPVEPRGEGLEIARSVVAGRAEEGTPGHSRRRGEAQRPEDGGKDVHVPRGPRVGARRDPAGRPHCN